MAPRNGSTNRPSSTNSAFIWWFGLQVLLPVSVAIFMWYPVAEEFREVKFSFAKSFASGDLSLFASLLFFGVLAEAEGIDQEDVWGTVYKVTSILAGIVSLIVFTISKDVTTDFDFPKTIDQVLPKNVSALSNLNFLIGMCSVLFVTTFIADLRRRKRR